MALYNKDNPEKQYPHNNEELTFSSSYFLIEMINLLNYCKLLIDMLS